MRCPIVIIAGFWVLSAWVASPSAYAAEDETAAYGSLQLGAWKGFFSQAGEGLEADHNTNVSPGLGLQLGYEIHRFFIEYNVSILGYGGNLDGASYHSYLGGNLGFDVPVLPLIIYGGWEKSTYYFRNAGGFDYTGNTLKAGVGVEFGRLDGVRAGVRAEYRLMYIGSDQAGDIPSVYTTRASIVFAGLSISYGHGRN